MAYQLTREVLDHAPAALGAGERLVLLAIAEFAPLSTRRFTGPQDLISQRAHLTTDGTRKALQRLGRRGLETRVAITTGRDGRAVYTVPGRSPTFRVPVLAPAGCRCWSCAGDPQPRPQGGTDVPPNESEGGTGVPPNASEGGTGELGRRDESAYKAGPQSWAAQPPGPALSEPKDSVPGSACAPASTPAPALDDSPPHARCPRHLEEPAPGPCGACGDARRRREAWFEDVAARQAAAGERGRRCPWCQGGWLEDPETRDPLVKCDHRTDPAEQVADFLRAWAS